MASTLAHGNIISTPFRVLLRLRFPKLLAQLMHFVGTGAAARSPSLLASLERELHQKEVRDRVVRCLEIILSILSQTSMRAFS